LLAFLCEVPVVWSFVYLTLGRVLELIVLCCRSAKAKEVEILVLRHELAVLRRQHPRSRLQAKDRALLAALSRQLPRARWSVFLIKPETLLGWHRRMVRRRWTYPTVSMGRPPVPDRVQQLIVRLARENPRWGYQRIRGELLRLGCRISVSSISRVLRAHGIHPAPRRAPTTWRSFFRRQAAGILSATSSPSTGCSCGGCMCCLSSSSQPAFTDVTCSKVAPRLPTSCMNRICAPYGPRSTTAGSYLLISGRRRCL
jgi:hypothetical protein